LLRAAGVLYCPTRNGLETVQALLAQGADVNAKDNLGYTALMYAKEMGYVETIRMLKKAGAK
jgi:ankyrin repeat protein